jgi:hypothetical protein
MLSVHMRAGLFATISFRVETGGLMQAIRNRQRPTDVPSRAKTKVHKMARRIDTALTWTAFTGIFWWLNVLVLKGSGSLGLLLAYMISPPIALI